MRTETERHEPFAGVKRGRPAREDVDMVRVYALLGSLSVRQIANQMGVHCNTISYRLRAWKDQDLTDYPNPYPFCIEDKSRMYLRRSVRGKIYYYCAQCGVSTLLRKTPKPVSHRIGRPPRDIDLARASDLLLKHPVIQVAEMLGVHRNLLYYRIGRSMMAGRPFRTWTARHAGEAALLYWPYMTANDPRYDDIIRDVNEAVSRGIPDAVRADICQEIVVSVLTGEIRQEEIKSAVKQHMRRHYQMFPTKSYQTISLDTPLRGGDGPNDRRLIDTLNAEVIAERISDAWAANRLTEPIRRKSAHFNRVTHARHPGQNLSGSEYARLRGRYELVNGRVRVSEHEQLERITGSWTVETALPEEIGRVQL